MSSENVNVTCSYCTATFQAVATDVDRLVKCPHCNFMTKIPRLAPKRMKDLKCPECQIEWDIPIKMRGKSYQCWGCGYQTTIISPTQLNIEQVVFPSHIEQDSQIPFKIVITNLGTKGQLQDIRMLFLHEQQDVSSYYQAQFAEGHPTEVEYQTSIELTGTIAIHSDAPAGWTTLTMEVIGIDVLDGNQVACNRQVEWMVCYQRVFAIETEHQNKEHAGVPFSINLWACFPNGEVDQSYQGSHHILLQHNQNMSSPAAPQIPSELDLFFQQGMASSQPVFTFFESSQPVQLMAQEEVPGGPKGVSEMIGILAGEFCTFEIRLQSPQIDHCPFHGRNTIRAVDQYGNTIEDFAQDVWLHPTNNKGEFELGNTPTNIIPGSVFRGGVVDLASLNFIYNADPKDLLPAEISFIVSYQNKEECSEPIFIEPNPVQIAILPIVVPEAIERNQEIHTALEIVNKGKFELKINPADGRFVFLHQGNVLENMYKVQSEQLQIISLASNAQARIPIAISSSDQCPLGKTEFHVMIFAYDPVNAWYGRTVGEQSWNVVPSGRVFRMLEPSPAIIEAGEPYAITVAAFLQDSIDKSYHGKHTLVCEATAPESPNNIASQIPGKIEVEFDQGIGRTNPCFVLTNSSSPATIKMGDPEAGGPKSEVWTFEVHPGKLEFFVVNLQAELMNSRCFEESNQIMAMDAYGNLIVDFNENCQLLSLHKKGEIKIGDQSSCVIPGTAFHQGIVDLSDLNISYHSHIAANLPDSEEFVVMCNHKKGQSKPVNITPRPGKINVVRCSAPEEVEQSGEDYPIYLELENQGDRTVDISSQVFTFRHQEEDISSHYTIIPHTNNSNSLSAGIPLQLVYTVKVNAKAPIGVTDVLVKISGIDSQTRLPMQTTATFQWKIEPKQRFFRITTEHENQETAGVLFATKIISYLENQQRDPSLQGDYNLEFTTNATGIGNYNPEVPNRLKVSFVRGEAVTARVFKLVNANESPFIQVKDLTSKAQGHTGTIRVAADAELQLSIQLESETTNTKLLRGHNTITATDSFGNLKKNFASDLTISFIPDIVSCANPQGVKLTTIRADWFRDGVVDLSSKEILLYCPDETKLPIHVQLRVAAPGTKGFLSNPVRILPSPVQVILDKLEVPPKILPGRAFPLRISLVNSGVYPVKMQQFAIAFYQGETLYKDYQIKTEDPNQSDMLIPGVNTLRYNVMLGQGIGYGKILGKLVVILLSAAGQKLALPEISFSIYIEATGRVFRLTTTNNQQETAGNPFGIQIAAMLENDADVGYEGTHTLNFTSNAAVAITGQKPEIPASLALSFVKGKCLTPNKFILVRSGSPAEIKVQEITEGGQPTTGTTGAITVEPGPINKLKMEMEPKQVHLTPFVGTNRITALDAYGNLQKNFQSEVSLVIKQPKAKFTCARLSSTTIPKEYFRDGQLDLTPLGLCYEIDDTSILPITEIIYAVCQKQELAKQEITIQPRPGTIQLEDLTITGSFYQGQKGITMTFTVTNSGDSKMLLNNVLIQFENDGDVTELFSVIGHPQNRTLILPHSKVDLQYFVDINPQAKIGKTKVSVLAQATDTIYNQPLESSGNAEIVVIEKMRDFKIDTEHGNQEIAGIPFFIKLVAMKDQEIDRSYHGTHEVRFSLETKNTPRHPQSCPDKEVIQFAHGHGQTTNSFMLTDTTDRVVIKAEEAGKAKGASHSVALTPATMRGFKIFFPQGKEKGYRLTPLDSFDNPLQKNYPLDEDVRPGAILSGSYGNFYEVQDLIGVGAMGKVYRGLRLNDNLDVAIKTTMFSALSDINRFLLEGLMLIKFDHPNIVKGYDLRQLCIQEGPRAVCKLFMVMEYLPGQNAKDILDSSKSGVVTPIMATRIILYTAKALAYMWEHQTTHRDIKPENIQLTVKDEIKLIDLGIAHAEMGEVDINITQRDTIVGSYPYISPERFKSTASDFRSDIYSLGATYYQLLCGMAPYIDSYKGPGGKDLYEYLIKSRTKKPPTPIQKLANVSDSIAKSVMIMLEIQAKQRYQSAEELIRALENIYQEMGGKL